MLSPSITLKEWCREIGGPATELLELRRFASGVWALILKNGTRGFIKIPDRVSLTFEEHGFIEAGPISKIKGRPEDSLEPYPYYPNIK